MLGGVGAIDIRGRGLLAEATKLVILNIRTCTIVEAGTLQSQLDCPVNT